MTSPALQSPDAPYLAAVDRTEELTKLRAQAQKRKSMLVFGPQGVGKTRLLLAFVQDQPFALYVPQTRTPRDLMMSLTPSGQAGTPPAREHRLAQHPIAQRHRAAGPGSVSMHARARSPGRTVSRRDGHHQGVQRLWTQAHLFCRTHSAHGRHRRPPADVRRSLRTARSKKLSPSHRPRIRHKSGRAQRPLGLEPRLGPALARRVE